MQERPLAHKIYFLAHPIQKMFCFIFPLLLIFGGRKISWPYFCSKETMCVCVSVPVLSRSVVSDSCDPIDCSLLDFSVYWILQARILEGVANFFSRGSSQLRNWTWVSCVAGGFFTSWATREAQYEQRGAAVKTDEAPLAGPPLTSCSVWPSC